MLTQYDRQSVNLVSFHIYIYSIICTCHVSLLQLNDIILHYVCKSKEYFRCFMNEEKASWSSSAVCLTNQRWPSVQTPPRFMYFQKVLPGLIQGLLGEEINPPELKLDPCPCGRKRNNFFRRFLDQGESSCGRNMAFM